MTCVLEEFIHNALASRSTACLGGVYSESWLTD